MSTRSYDNGQLVAEWDDVTRIYRRYANGVIVEQRAYTAGEIAGIQTLGAVTVTGKDVYMYDDDGSVLFRLGGQTYGDRGVSIFRDDTSVAFAVRKQFANTVQTAEIRAAQGYIILGEEALGVGLSRPFLHVPMTPVLATAGAIQVGPFGAQVPVASTSWTTTHQAWIARANHYARFKFRISASDATTAAEVQIINADLGTPLPRFFDVPWVGTRAAGSTGFVAVDSDRMLLPGNPDDAITVAAQVRRTAGTGTLQVALIESHGA